jgi:hypothetical protein
MQTYFFPINAAMNDAILSGGFLEFHRKPDQIYISRVNDAKSRKIAARYVPEGHAQLPLPAVDAIVDLRTISLNAKRNQHVRFLTISVDKCAQIKIDLD